MRGAPSWTPSEGHMDKREMKFIIEPLGGSRPVLDVDRLVGGTDRGSFELSTRDRKDQAKFPMRDVKSIVAPAPELDEEPLWPHRTAPSR